MGVYEENSAGQNLSNEALFEEDCAGGPVFETTFQDILAGCEAMLGL